LRINGWRALYFPNMVDKGINGTYNKNMVNNGIWIYYVDYLLGKSRFGGVVLFLSYTHNVSWQTINDVLYIVDERDSSIYSLGNAGKDFWALIGELHDYRVIMLSLLKRYNVEEQVLNVDLLQLAEELEHMEFVNCLSEDEI